MRTVSASSARRNARIILALAATIPIFFHSAMPVAAAAAQDVVLARPDATAQDVARGLWSYLRDLGGFTSHDAIMERLLEPVAAASMQKARG